MQAEKAAEGDHTSPHRFSRSVAASAQLLELWVQGRCRLNRDEVEHYLHLLSRLDMAVGDKYDAVFVNSDVSRETPV